MYSQVQSLNLTKTKFNTNTNTLSQRTYENDDNPYDQLYNKVLTRFKSHDNINEIDSQNKLREMSSPNSFKNYLNLNPKSF